MANKHAIGSLKTTAPDMETKETSPANKTNPTDLVKPERELHPLLMVKLEGKFWGLFAVLK